MRFKAEHHVPVLVQMLDVAASGGYYVSLAADEIIASPTTVTGSIGVIFTNISVAGLMEKLGVRDQTVASGAMKDIGSPLRTMTPAERAVLETADRRHAGALRRPGARAPPDLTPEMSTTMTDGRVFSADQALQGGLVDGIGYLDDTIDRAKQRAGVREARVIRYRRPDEFGDSIYARAGRAAPQVTQISLLNFEDRAAAARPQLPLPLGAVSGARAPHRADGYG